MQTHVTITLPAPSFRKIGVASLKGCRFEAIRRSFELFAKKSIVILDNQLGIMYGSITEARSNCAIN